MNGKVKKKLDDVLIECGYSHIESKEVIKRYDKNLDNLYKLGEIDFRKEDPNGEVIEKKEVTETVADEINEKDIDVLIKIENLRLQYENNKLLNKLQIDLKNFSNAQKDIIDINKTVKRNSNLIDYFATALNSISTIKRIMIFLLVLTIISLIGSIYTAVKIGEFIGHFERIVETIG